MTGRVVAPAIRDVGPLTFEIQPGNFSVIVAHGNGAVLISDSALTLTSPRQALVTEALLVDALDKVRHALSELQAVREHERRGGEVSTP